MGGHGEPEAGVHPRRVPLHGGIQEFGEAGELDDPIQFPRLAVAMAEDVPFR